MPQPEHKIKPNTTSVSNLFLDHMYWYSGNAVKIFSFISRKTSGWHKETQWCSITYILEGTGIGNKNSVIKEVNTLLRDGWIERKPIKVQGGISYEYLLSESINIEVVSKTYQYESDTGIKNVPVSGTKVIPLKAKSGTKLIHNKRNNLLNKQLKKETKDIPSKEILNKTEKALLKAFIEHYNQFSKRQTQGTIACQRQFKKFLKEAEYNPDLIEHTVFAFCNDRWRKDTGNNDLSYLFRAVNYSKYENMTISQLNDLNFQYCKKAGLEHRNVISPEDIRKAEEAKRLESARVIAEEEERKRKQAEYDALPEENKFQIERQRYIKLGVKLPMARSVEKDQRFNVIDWDEEKKALENKVGMEIEEVKTTSMST